MGDRGVGFSFRPSFEGTLSAEHVPDDFFERVQRRVRDGLLVPGRRARANYRVTSASSQGLVIEAGDFLTAYAIGLNHVELRRSGSATISYRVRFARWNRYAVIHGALIGLALALAYLVPAVQADVHRYPNGPWIFWGMVLFWSLVWPWILTAIHRPFARKALERIMLEELTTDSRARSAS